MVTATKMRNRRIRSIAWCAIVIFLASTVMFAQAPGTAANGAHSQVPASPSLPISFGDLIQVNVFDNPDLSGSLRVDSKGAVELPLGGAIKVNGMTAAEAGTAIATRLKEAGILLDPHVTVLILEYQSQGVTITGEVRNPGVYPLFGNRTVLDMVAMAGGLNENAGKVASVFHRGNPNDVRQIRLVSPYRLQARLQQAILNYSLETRFQSLGLASSMW